MSADDEVPGDDAPVEPESGPTTEALVFLGFTAFYLFIALIYGVTSDGEWAGVALLGFAAVFTAVAGLWFLRLRPVQHDAEVAEEAAEPGEVADPHGSLYLPATSVWPLGLGVGTALVLAGFAVGWPLWLPGAALLGYSVLGLAHQSRERDPG